MTEMNLGQHGNLSAPPIQTVLHEVGHTSGLHTSPVQFGSLADKLRVAASKGQTDKVHELLQAGAGFEPDRDGRTALHYAAQNGYVDTCKLLIEKGCDLNSQDVMGYTPLLRASSQGMLDAVRICLEAGCAVDFADEHGNSALHEAAWRGFSKSVELLIKYNSNVFKTNHQGFTALHMAAQNGHNESSRALLYGGINPDIQNNYGDTALHTAARYGHAGVTRILISAKAKLNIQNKNGDSALHIAAALKRRKIAKILVESHIDINMKNKQNETAIEVAKRKEYADIILIISSISRPHSTGPRVRDPPAVTFKDDIEIDDGPVVCADDEPQLKSDKQEKDKGFFAFFKKKKKEKEKDKPGQTIVSTQVKKPIPPAKVQPVTGKPVPGFFSQYVPRQGLQYYRDLAGNIKQGPIGYSPVCQCGPALSFLERSMNETRDQLYDHIDATHQVLHDRIEQLDKRTSQQAHSIDRLTLERLEAERRRCQATLNERLQHERHHTHYIMETYGDGLQDDIQNWLEDRMASYGHCLDHHHDDTALPPRHIFSDIHLGPDGGRLFRSRSDETLSASDYSGRGRKKQFYESRKAAMEQIRGWKVPPVTRDSSKRRDRGRSAEVLANVDTKILERNNISNKSRNSIHDVSGGRVTVTTADVHKSHDRLADGASHKYESSPASAGMSGQQGQVTSQSARDISTGVSGLKIGYQTQVSSQGAIPKRHSQHVNQYSQSQLRQTHSQGNIAVQSTAAHAQSSHQGTGVRPGRSILRSKTEDTGLYQRAHSTSQQPNLGERGPLGGSDMLPNPSGREGPFLRDAGSIGKTSSVPPHVHQHNPLYGTHQSVLDTFSPSSIHTLEDGQSPPFRPQSSQAIVDGADLNSVKFRSRSVERMLDENDSADQLQREYSGYLTDSGLRTSFGHFQNDKLLYSENQHQSSINTRKSSYSTDPNLQTFSSERNITRPVSTEHYNDHITNYNVKSGFHERNSGYATDSNVRSAVSASLRPAPALNINQANRTSFTQQEAASFRTPTSRYRVIPPMSSASPVNGISHTPLLSGRDNTRLANSSGNVYVRTFDASNQQFSSSCSNRETHGSNQSQVENLAPRRSHEGTPNNGTSLGGFSSHATILHAAKDNQQQESPREKWSGLDQLSKDRMPYRSMHGLYQESYKRSTDVFDDPNPLQSGKASVSKSENNLVRDSECKDTSVLSNPQALNGCLRHDSYSYPPVYSTTGKEDSTCSSNQDSGYSSRVLGSKGPGYNSRGHSTDSATPSSSFSGDHNFSLSTPSNTSSPFLHSGGNSQEYSRTGSSSRSDFHQFGNSAPEYVHVGNSSQSDRQHIINASGFQHTGGHNPPDYQRLPLPVATSPRQPIAGSIPGSNLNANIQRQMQTTYQKKLLEAAERLRNSEQYNRLDSGFNYSSVPIRYDPVHGSDV